MEYKIEKDDGKGNRIAKPIRLIDSSKSIERFKHLIPSRITFDITGHCNVYRRYRNRQKMLLNLDKIDISEEGKSRIIKMVRNKKLEDVLSI